MEIKARVFRLFILDLLLLVSCSGEMFLEPGIFEFTMEINNTFNSISKNPEAEDVTEGAESTTVYVALTKSLFAHAEIGVEVSSITCVNSNKDPIFEMSWTLRRSDCDGIFTYLYEGANETAERKTTSNLYSYPNCFYMEEEFKIEYTSSKEAEDVLRCETTPPKYLQEMTGEKGVFWDCSARYNASGCNLVKPCGAGLSSAPEASAASKNEAKDPAKDKSQKGEGKKKKREVSDDGTNTPTGNTGDKPTNKQPVKTDANKSTAPESTARNNTLLRHRVTQPLDKDGRFIFILKLNVVPPFDDKKDSISVAVKVFMKSPSGYLSATQYPLLPFYGVMCAVYSILALVWLFLLSRQWRDLLRIQFWISAVIVLGLIEKAAFVAEFDRHNKNGESSNFGVFIAEEMSVLKRTMARILVIVVSLGYGITRPRLGNDQNWVLGAGVLFFLLSSLEAYFRITHNATSSMIALLPLSVLDAVLCWWIFRSLVDTTRTLRLRRNLVKLWLYRHFTNALIFCVVAALVFLIWSIKVHKMNKCVKKWNELWLDDAYWHILFCVILVVIMILLRPTANNQRYAYSVLSDAAEDEDSKEPMINDAFENLKMRPGHSKTSTQNSNREEDDLEWVEKNFPATVADRALGALDDSEEELITSVERNKME